LPTQQLHLYTISMAAQRLGTSRDQIWYAIRQGIWRPRFLLGQSYVLNDEDLAELRTALAGSKRIARRVKGRFLREQAEPEPENLPASDTLSRKHVTRSPKAR
jgi:hypothetical protein